MRKQERAKTDNLAQTEDEVGCGDTVIELEWMIEISHSQGRNVVILFQFKSQANLTFPGEHIILRMQGLARPYTPVSIASHFDDESQELSVTGLSGLDSERNGVYTLQLCIKIYEQGAMTQMLQSLKPGQTLTATGPLFRNELMAETAEYGDGCWRNVLLLVCGTGITPVFEMIRHYITHGKMTHLLLQWSNKTVYDAFLTTYLRKLSHLCDTTASEKCKLSCSFNFEYVEEDEDTLIEEIESWATVVPERKRIDSGLIKQLLGRLCLPRRTQAKSTAKDTAGLPQVTYIITNFPTGPHDFPTDRDPGTIMTSFNDIMDQIGAIKGAHPTGDLVEFEANPMSSQDIKSTERDMQELLGPDLTFSLQVKNDVDGMLGADLAGVDDADGMLGADLAGGYDNLVEESLFDLQRSKGGSTLDPDCDRVFVCGTKSFANGMNLMLQESGVSDQAIILFD